MKSEAKKKADKKWNSENMRTVSLTYRKEKAEDLRIYAESQGLTLANFARLACQYCKNNNINLRQDTSEKQAEK